MEFLLSSSERGLLCNANSCLSWIFVIINFMTVFYLAFCMYYKLNKIVKVIGFVWSAMVAVGSVVLVALHTCLFTIICTVFTALMIFATLYVLFTNKKDIIKPRCKKEPEEPKKEVEEESAEVPVQSESYFVEGDLADDFEAFEEKDENDEIVEEIVENVSEEAPELYVFDDKTGKVVEDAVVDVVDSEPEIAVVEEDVQAPIEEKEPVIEEIIVPVKNKFTDIVVSQIEEIPEYEEINKSREELIKELENRPVMVKYQQVNFNQEAQPKPKASKKSAKKEIVESDKLVINRGYQINKIPRD